MDDFEGRLSVALKAAVRDLSSGLAAVPSRPAVDVVASSEPRRRRFRLVLATAVVVVVLLAGGGAWWTVAGAGHHPAASATASCTDADVSVVQIAPAATGVNTMVVALGVRARTACSMLQPPTLYAGEIAVPWRAVAGDIPWTPVTLAADDLLAFGVSLRPTKGICRDVAEHIVSFRFGLDTSASATTFQRTVDDQCSEYVLTTVPELSSLTSGPSGATAPCTYDDVAVEEHPASPTAATGVLTTVTVTATTACVLYRPPVLYVGSKTIPWDATPQDTTDPNVWSQVDLPVSGVIGFDVVADVLPGPVGCSGPTRDLDLAFGLSVDDGPDLSFTETVSGCTVVHLDTSGS